MRAFLSVQRLCVSIAFAVVALIGCTAAGCAFHPGVTTVGGGEFVISPASWSGMSRPRAQRIQIRTNTTPIYCFFEQHKEDGRVTHNEILCA